MAKEGALTKLLRPDRKGQCRGVGLGVTPTNLFGKKPYKEALAVGQAMVKEYA